MGDNNRKKLIVYVHIPFCNSKCHFCDWVPEIPTALLLLKSESSLRTKYIQALKKQIHYYAHYLKKHNYVPEILYWGGGTASILTISEIHDIMGALKDVFDMGNLIESTIECSPETLTPDKLEAFFEMGFERISIGIQSLNDKHLKKMGRAHNAQEAIESCRLAKEAGFSDINIDLISGFPDETLKDIEETISEVLKLPVNHVSLYPYRTVPGTVMYRQLRRGVIGKLQIDNQLSAYKRGRELLNEAGLTEYAFSHFGQPRCHSDMAYFKLEMDWIGFGSGATSLLNHQFLATKRGTLERYVSQPTTFDEEVSAASPSITSRLIYQSLSTPEGAVKELWKERTGVDLHEILEQPPNVYLLNFIKRVTGLIYNDEGVCLPEDKIANVFINLLFLNSPRQAQDMISARNTFGGY